MTFTYSSLIRKPDIPCIGYGLRAKRRFIIMAATFNVSTTARSYRPAIAVVSL